MSEPAGRTTVRVCRAEACQAVGADRLVAHLRDRYGVSLGETTRDGSVTAEQVFCLGNCALGPAAQVNGRLHGRLDEARLSSIHRGGGLAMSTSTAAPVTVYVPRDSAATSVGADEVADALVRAAAREQDAQSS